MSTPTDTKNASTVNLSANLTLLSGVIADTSRHAHTPDQKQLLYNMTSELARKIGKVDTSGSFSESQFMKDCGINPEWAKERAA